MRIFILLTLTVVPALAQSPVVRVINATRPASKDFQIGDRFEIVITGAASQPVSVRTTRMGKMDWGPVIGWTDTSGRWTTTGQFQKDDFGAWSEVWTVGHKLATPAVQLSVNAPCLPNGQEFAMTSGPNVTIRCDTVDGPRTFSSLSDSDTFLTPDGRIVEGRQRSNMTPEQYHAEILQSFMTSSPEGRSSGVYGGEAVTLIQKIIGVNALSDEETRNVLVILRAAFEKPERIPQEARDPSGTLLFLRGLADLTDQKSLKQQIVETMAYVQGH